MNNHDSQSGSGADAPRKNLLRHHELKREREPSPPPEDVPPDGPDADLPSSTSLKAALARANLLEEPNPSASASASVPGESPGPDAPVRSSLPLALARANESRKLPPKPIEEQDEVLESEEKGNGGSLTDFLFSFGSFSDRLHPLRGWGLFSVFYVLTVLILGHGLAIHCLSCHPGALRVSDQMGFWAAQLGRAFGIGVGLTLFLAVLALLLYRAAKGSPPFLWVFKIVVYALMPVTFARIYLLLDLSEVGLEAYVRGYRPEHWLFLGRIVFSITGVWFAIRLIQSAASRHCQARAQSMILPMMMFVLIGLGLLWGHPLILNVTGREALSRELREAEKQFLGLNPEASEAVERLGRRGTYEWSHALKTDFYRLRGEVRFLEGNVSGGREDMIRLVRMHPPGHPMAAYGRAVNFLAMGRQEEAGRILEAVNRVTGGEVPDTTRWLYRIRRGDFGEEGEDPAEAERIARDLQYADPNSMHLEMAVEALFAVGQYRRVIRELGEAERMNVSPSLSSLVHGARAALTQERLDLAERWWTQALELDPAAGGEAGGEALREQFTNRP